MITEVSLRGPSASSASKRLFGAGVITVLSVMLLGCHPAARPAPVAAPGDALELQKPPSPVPNSVSAAQPKEKSAQEIVSIYNFHVRTVTSLWCETRSTNTWWSTDGEKHFDNGEGFLALQLPNSVAITAGAMGEVAMWAGCDAVRGWLFLSPIGEGKKEAWIVRHENVGKPCCKQLPLLVQPLDMLGLVGLLLLPEQTQDGGELTSNKTLVGKARTVKGADVWSLETSHPFGRILIYVEIQDMLPHRVELYGRESAEPLVVSDLNDYAAVPETAGTAVEVWVPKQIVITSKPLRFELTIKVDTIGLHPPDRTDIAPGVFDFGTIAPSMGSEIITVLDEDCVNPAIEKRNQFQAPQ